MKKLLTVTLLSSIVCANAVSTTSSNKKLVQDFCYSLQASGQCNNLSMRFGTEDEIDKIVGTQVRGPNSPYNQECLLGIQKAIQDDKKSCKKAWDDFGCFGKKRTGLVQSNASDKNGSFCKFNNN